MANKKISELTENSAALAAGDLVALVDVSDTTDAASGTTKKQTWLNTIKFLLASVFAEDAGANDTYTATLVPVPAAYVTGHPYRFKANTANTGACTINFNSLGAKTIKKATGGITTDLADNDIRAGQWVDLVYDGTSMQMQSTLGNQDGYINIPQNSQSANYTTVLADQGKHIYHPTSDDNPRTFTIDSNANVPYQIGTAITFVNDQNTVTIAITSDTLVWAEDGSTGSRTLAENGMATVIKVTSTRWIISGTGLS